MREGGIWDLLEVATAGFLEELEELEELMEDSSEEEDVSDLGDRDSGDEVALG